MLKLMPRAAALGFTLLFAGCGEERGERAGGVEQTGHAWSIAQARVVFTGQRGGVQDLYLLDRSRAVTTRVTHYGGEGSGANYGRYSPDGAYLAFQIRQESDYEVVVMNTADSSVVNLSRHPDFDVTPAWAPDSRRLAFMSTRGYVLGEEGPFPGHIYLTDVTGGEPRRLTKKILTSALGPSDWSADGEHILLARVEGERPDLYLLQVGTGEETRLTETLAGEYSACFSPDQTRIAFHVEDADSSQIAVMELVSQTVRLITRGPGWRYSPRWSPDGEWLLYTFSNDGRQYDIMAVRVADGSELALVATEEDERGADWAPAAIAPPAGLPLSEEDK